MLKMSHQREISDINSKRIDCIFESIAYDRAYSAGFESYQVWLFDNEKYAHVKPFVVYCAIVENSIITS